jgi:hypothetical protein
MELKKTPKLFFAKNQKKYAHKKKRKKMEIRALWSQPLFSEILQNSILKILKNQRVNLKFFKIEFQKISENVRIVW